MTLAVGDHLIVSRPLFKGYGHLYTHHGIYVGANMVIHYAGLANGVFKKGSSHVQLASLKDFADGQKIEVHHYDSRPFHAAKIVERARARLGEDRYHLVFNNCEHFSRHCCVGENSSKQVFKALLTAGILTTAAGLRALR